MQVEALEEKRVTARTEGSGDGVCDRFQNSRKRVSQNPRCFLLAPLAGFETVMKR